MQHEDVTDTRPADPSPAHRDLSTPRSLASTGRGPRREDTVAWYRQFWPWFLIALPGSVVIAALSTVYIANRHADDLVVDDYYKDGLAINVQLEKHRAAAELGVTASLSIFERRLQVRLNEPLSEASLTLLLSHPLEADRDFSIEVARLAPGLYGAELPSEVQENWHWILQPASGRWRLDGALEAGDFLGNDL